MSGARAAITDRAFHFATAGALAALRVDRFREQQLAVRPETVAHQPEKNIECLDWQVMQAADAGHERVTSGSCSRYWKKSECTSAQRSASVAARMRLSARSSISRL